MLYKFGRILDKFGKKKLKKLDLLGFVEFAFSNSGLLLWNRGGLVKGCGYKFRI